MRGLSWYLLFIAVQLIWHSIIILREKRSPNHALHAVIRLIVAVFIMYHKHEFSILHLVTYGMAFWFLFDTGLNLIRKERIDYLATHGIDGLQKKYGGEALWFGIKLIACLELGYQYYIH